jgi:hypothetical protein
MTRTYSISNCYNTGVQKPIIKTGRNRKAIRVGKAGFKSTGVFHSVDNANKITIIGEAPSVEAINGFMANPELKAAMDKGGVIGIPDVKILNKV